MTAPLRANITALVTRQRQQLAAELEEMRAALLDHGHPAEAHAWLDADPDTAYPLPGVAHPKTAGGTR